MKRTEFYSGEVYTIIVTYLDKLIDIAEEAARGWERRATGWDGWNTKSAKAVLKDCRDDLRRMRSLKARAKEIWRP
jgi:hypothetical protein